MSEAPQQKKKIEGLDIRYEPSTKTYFISLDVESFHRSVDKGAHLFYVWLYGRTPDETLQLSFTGGTREFVPESYLTLINAIDISPAQVHARLDHITDGAKAYIALSADKLILSDYGLLRITPIIQADGDTELRKQQKASAEYFFQVLEKAVARNILTQEENDQVRQGSVVYIYAETIKNRTS